jgi:hypothetical protein
MSIITLVLATVAPLVAPLTEAFIVPRPICSHRLSVARALVLLTAIRAMVSASEVAVALKPVASKAVALMAVAAGAVKVVKTVITAVVAIAAGAVEVVKTVITAVVAAVAIERARAPALALLMVFLALRMVFLALRMVFLALRMVFLARATAVVATLTKGEGEV